MRLQDKVAVVTGGASGFGAGIVRKFAEEGARVVVADLNVNGAHEIAAEVKGLGIQVDVADGASVAAMVDATLGAYGRLDILVNNAGRRWPSNWHRKVSESTRSIPSLGKRLCSRSLWVKTHRKSAQSSCPQFQSAGFPSQAIWAMPLASCARTRPAWSRASAWRWTVAGVFDARSTRPRNANKGTI